MSISVNMEMDDGLIEIPVATTEFFEKYWEKAIKECELKVFREYNCFRKQQTDQVISELRLLKKWVEKNLVGREYVYMYERIENLEIEIPKMFEEHTNAILYID